METFETAVSRMVRSFLAEAFTALPAKIVRINSADTLSIDVQPLVNALYADGTSFERPVLLEVPVVFPATTNAMLRLPIAVGDTVLLVFSMRNIENFKSGDGEPTDPADFRKLSKQDAIAIPGLFPFEMNPNLSRGLPSSDTDLSLTANIGQSTEVTVRLTQDGEIKILAPAGAVSVEAQDVNITAAATISFAAANVDFTGIVTINGVPYTAHTHSGVTSGPSVTGPVVV